MDTTFARFVLTGATLNNNFNSSSIPTPFDDQVFHSVTIQFQDVINQPAGGTASQVDIAAQAKVTVDYGTSHTQGEVIAPQI
jgi:hypothetical protein